MASLRPRPSIILEFSPLTFLPFRADRSRREIRVWREIVELLPEANAEDCPVAGLRTLSWCAIPEPAIGRPTRLASILASTAKLEKREWGVEFHELGSRQLERAGCYGGPDICNCACLEDVVRQVQMVECAYLQSHQNNTGGGKGRFGIALSPERTESRATTWSIRTFLDFVSQEVERAAFISEQIRKAREETHFAQKNKEDTMEARMITNQTF